MDKYQVRRLLIVISGLMLCYGIGLIPEVFLNEPHIPWIIALLMGLFIILVGGLIIAFILAAISQIIQWIIGND